MSEESKVRSDLIPLLAPLLAFPVENAVGSPGVPDMCCLAGWIELKLGKKPHLEISRVEIDVRPAQRLWMKNWRAHGGPGWYLTRVRDSGVFEWFLHDGAWAAENLGKVSIGMLRRSAIMNEYSSGLPSARTLIDALLTKRAIHFISYTCDSSSRTRARCSCTWESDFYTVGADAVRAGDEHMRRIA